MRRWWHILMWMAGVSVVLVVAVPAVVALLVLFGLPGLVVGVLLYLVCIPVGLVLGMGFGLAGEAIMLPVRFILWIVRLPLVIVRKATRG